MIEKLHPATTPLTRRSFLTTSARIAGVLAGGSALLSACGTSTSSSQGPTTITVMYNSGEFTKQHVALFEQQNPQIKINFLEYDATKLNVMTAAGNSPDFIRHAGAPAVPNDAARGLLTDLTDYFAHSSVLKADNLQPINDVYRFDGHLQGQGPRYGMAKDWSQDVTLWYNKHLFDQAGQPYPSATEPLTYDQLLTLGKKLTTRNGDKITSYGLNIEWGFFTQGTIMQQLEQTGTSMWNSDYTQATLNSSEARRIFQWYVDWAQARVGPSPITAEANWDGVLFPSGRTAISMLGYFFGGLVAQSAQGSQSTILDTMAMAPAPLWGTKRISACLTGTGAVIPTGAKHKAEAWKVMEFFMGGQPAVERSKTGFGIPALKSLLSNLPQAKPYQQEAYQVVQNELPYLEVLHFSPYVSDSAMSSAITNYVGQAMQGKLTVEQAADQLQTAVNLLIQQGKDQVG